MIYFGVSYSGYYLVVIYQYCNRTNMFGNIVVCLSGQVRLVNGISCLLVISYKTCDAFVPKMKLVCVISKSKHLDEQQSAVIKLPDIRRTIHFPIQFNQSSRFTVAYIFNILMNALCQINVQSQRIITILGQVLSVVYFVIVISTDSFSELSFLFCYS